MLLRGFLFCNLRFHNTRCLLNTYLREPLYNVCVFQLIYIILYCIICKFVISIRMRLYARLGINVLNSLTTKNHCLNYSNNL